MEFFGECFASVVVRRTRSRSPARLTRSVRDRRSMSKAFIPCSTAASRSPRRAFTMPRSMWASATRLGALDVPSGRVCIWMVSRACSLARSSSSSQCVAGGGVEHPFGVVEHEVVVGVVGYLQLGQDRCASGEGLVGFAAVTDAGEPASFLQAELDHGAGLAGDFLADAG